MPESDLVYCAVVPRVSQVLDVRGSSEGLSGNRLDEVLTQVSVERKKSD